MKKVLYSSLALSAFLLSAGSALALTQPPVRAQTQMEKMNAAKPTETLAVRTQKELERRINALEKVLDRINKMNKISETQKAALTQGIDEQIASLTALKEKIKAGTSPAELNSDVASVVKDYRIFALYLPKVNIISMSDRMINVTDKFTQMLATLQVRISEARERGEDVVAEEKLLSDAQKKVISATTNAQNALNLASPLTPEGFPANKKILMNARIQLMKAHQDLISARIDVREIRQALKAGRMDKPKDTKTTLAPSVTGVVSVVPSKP